ncbi:hypothetical protein [Synechococcus sp. CCY 9618]|uniref:hypothetical protein n=1 Tax=Synechococcus sp. CCY 9618 TaxID=2815602 RepID=UPI001C21F0E5|nr:hypothetical protein [Synechococcus sp. CCY 9618]
MSDPSDPIDLPGQLEALTGMLTDSNPQLYRHLALYLQVLRQVLPQRVSQACFHLATQVHPQRYAELSQERRKWLHRQVEQLVRRCSSLLTVEQLAILADQIARENQRRRRHDQQQILTELTLAGDPEPIPGSDVSAELLPPGSVQLALAPPLSGMAFAWSRIGHGDSRQEEDGEEPEAETAETGLEDHQSLARVLAAGQTDRSDEPDPTGEETGTEAATQGDGSMDGQSPDSIWQPGRLPRDPRQVLRWMDGMELALARRLRNLSHAINVELLRAGVNRSLLPVSLLDAVLTGQLDTMAAPPNLLRLPLPFGGGVGSTQAQTMAVLLRAVEMELEEPRLRTCRRRLQQHRQEVRRMAQQFRRLQGRLRIHQAEQLWLQDIRPTPNPDD